MKKNFFSIIVPVYNGEKHIENCIQKLLKQSYDNYEIIVVNDGSSDKTSEIVSKYVLSHDKIRLINKENQGVSVARNVGIENAQGDYILFVDSDDYLDENALNTLDSLLEQRKCDLLIYGFTVLGSSNRFNDTETLKVMIENSKMNKNDLLKALISTKNNILGYIWRAAYSRKMLLTNDILFPDGIKISEDYMFLLNAVNSSKDVLVSDKELYYYCINEESMSIKYIPSLLEDMTFVNKWMYDTLVNDNEYLLTGYYCCVANTFLRFVQNSFRNKNRSFRKTCKMIISKKRTHQFQFALDKIWRYPTLFDKKSYFGILLFKLHLDFIYWILFVCKERIKQK